MLAYFLSQFPQCNQYLNFLLSQRVLRYLAHLCVSLHLWWKEWA